MAKKCACHWLLCLEAKGIIPTWASDFETGLENVDVGGAVKEDNNFDIDREEIDFENEDEN